MSELVTDEMVEAAHAVIDREIGAECPTPSECAACDAHQAAAAILEAVAPLIAAAAVRRAVYMADEAFAQEDIAVTQWGNGYIDGQGAALEFIHNCAEELEADRG